jgi:hypothetical protein
MMVGSVISFVLRICLIAVVWAFFWRLIEPKTQPQRLLRAGLLVAGLLVVLVMMRLFAA